MSYLRSILPTSESKYLHTEDVLKIWQEKILHTMLLVGALFGIVLTIYAIAPAFSSGDWTFFFGSMILASVSTLLFFFRKLSYWFRSVAALVAIYVFANVIFVKNGWGGLSLFLLLGFSFLCTTFLFKSPTRIGLGISIVTLLAWMVLRYTNIIPTIGASSSPYSILIDILLTFLVGVAGNLAIDALRTLYLDEHEKTVIGQEEIRSIQEQFDEQKNNLEKRLFQLKTAADISQAVSSILDPQILIKRVADLLQSRFSLYYVGIFLIEETRQYAILKYGTGEPGRQMLAGKHRLSVGGFSMIGWATQTMKARISLDTGEEAVRFDNPLLPDTRSELALPIVSGNRALGAMSIQSEKPNAFDESDILVLQTVADSLAIALENANSFQQTQKAIDDIRTLNKAYVQQTWWDMLESNKVVKYEYENPAAPQSKKQTSLVQIPLLLREQKIGNINLEMEESKVPSEQLEFLTSISSQTSVALENARLLEETQMAAIQEQRLNQLTSQFSRAVTIEDILKTAVSEFGNLPMVSEASISLIPPDEESLQVGQSLPRKEVK